jgi:hypothetical protein
VPGAALQAEPEGLELDSPELRSGSGLGLELVLLVSESVLELLAVLESKLEVGGLRSKLTAGVLMFDSRSDLGLVPKSMSTAGEVSERCSKLLVVLGVGLLAALRLAIWW